MVAEVETKRRELLVKPERKPIFTPRQIEVIQLSVDGLNNVIIAERMGISIKTVEKHKDDARLRIGDLLREERTTSLMAVVIAVLEGLVNVNNLPQKPKTLLTNREQEVLFLKVQGFSRSEIASQLFVRVGTVEAHQRHINKKFGVQTPSQLVATGALYLLKTQNNGSTLSQI